MGASVNMSPALPYIWDIIKNSLAGDQYDAASRDEMPENSAFVDPALTAKLREQVKTRQQAKEAAPLINRLNSLANDPQFQTAEGMKELRDDPKFWTGVENQSTEGRYPGDIKINPANPTMAGAIPAMQAGANKLLDTASVADRVQRGDTVPGMELARLMQDKEGSGALEKLISLGKYNDDLRGKRGVQDTINISAGASSNPLLQALAKATQYGVSVNDFNNLAKTYGLDPVDLKTVEAGDAKGNDTKYMVDPRSGKVVTTVGFPQQAGRNASKTTVTINPEALAASAMKAFGPQVMNDTGKRFEAAQKTAGLQRDYATMYKLLESGTPTGWGQETVMQARRLAQAAGVKDINKLNNQQLFDSVTAMISTKAVRQTDANPTQKQIEMVMSKYPGLKKEQAVNLAQIQLGMQANSAEIRSHNERLNGLKQLAGGDALGDAMVGQYNVSDPASGLILPADPIASMQKRPKTTGQPPKTASDYMKKWR